MKGGKEVKKNTILVCHKHIVVLHKGEEISSTLRSTLSDLLDNLFHETITLQWPFPYPQRFRREQDLQSTYTPTPLSIRNAIHGERKDNNSQDLCFIILLTDRKLEVHPFYPVLPFLSLGLSSAWG